MPKWIVIPEIIGGFLSMFLGAGCIALVFVFVVNLIAGGIGAEIGSVFGLTLAGGSNGLLIGWIVGFPFGVVIGIIVFSSTFRYSASLLLGVFGTMVGVLITYYWLGPLILTANLFPNIVTEARLLVGSTENFPYGISEEMLLVVSFLGIALLGTLGSHFILPVQLPRWIDFLQWESEE